MFLHQVLLRREISYLSLSGKSREIVLIIDISKYLIVPDYVSNNFKGAVSISSSSQPSAS